MPETLLSGKTSFKIEVPYKLLETGGKGSSKPLILYLHGFKQNIQRFQHYVEPLLEFRAYHLFVQGPYPIYDKKHSRNVTDWGRAWYLYDGEQQQFVRSLELTSEFLQQTIDDLLPHINVNRLALVGYSMGGYLAGYFSLSRWKHVNDIVVVGGRIKTEVFKGRSENFEHLNVLALHGSNDQAVKSDPQKKSIKILKKWGANVTFKELMTSHKFTSAYVDEIGNWFEGLGYQRNTD